MSKPRKGDICAVRIKRMTHFINPYRSEMREEWELLIVTACTRDGRIKLARRGIWGEGTKGAPADRFGGRKAEFLTISQDRQHAARRLFEHDPNKCWTDAEALRNAIKVAQIGILPKAT